MTKPNWKEWEHTPEVRVWQACALSLDIDPHSMIPDGAGWMAGPGYGPFFEDRSFPSNKVKDEFALRQRVLLANLSNRTIFSPGILSMGTPGNHHVKLSEFAFWAVSVVNWDNLPTEIQELAKSESKHRDKGIAAGFAEYVSNDKLIDWRYWVQQMPTLTAGQVARLMSGLDPDVFENLDTRPTRNDPSDQCDKAKKIQRLAESQGKNAATPCEWLDWADAHEFMVHVGFRLEVEELAKSQNPLGGVPAAQSEAGAGTKETAAVNWTPERRNQLRQEHSALKASGSKSPTMDLAKKYGVSDSRIRELKAEGDTAANPSNQKAALPDWLNPSPRTKAK